MSSKYSAGLANFLSDYEVRGNEAIRTRERNFGVQRATEEFGEPSVTIFLRTKPGAVLEGAPLDAVIDQSKERIRTATVPLSELDELAANPEVERIRLSRFLRPLMDVARPAIRLPAFLANHGGLSGKDVIIGIIDSGIDPKNDMISSSRILVALDQTRKMPGARRGGVKLVTSQEIQTLTDTTGHGTHVTGIAAGAHPRFGGVAQGASLIVVKTDFNDANIADGVRFIFEEAQRFSLPVVVNLSLGGHLDAHDGTDYLSHVIDQWSGPGRIVCCAAGNEGTRPIHARARVTPGADESITFLVSGSDDAVYLNGWYSGADIMEVALRSPNGQLTDFQGIQPDSSGVRHDVQGGFAIVSTPGRNEDNGDHHIHVQLMGNGLLAVGPWALVLRGQSLPGGWIDFWNDDNDDNELRGVQFTSHVDSQMKIGSPGCASSAITVGAFTTKEEWRISGHPVPFRWPGVTTGTLAPDSSPGPLRNLKPKPDLVAPGFVIASALSGQALQGTDFQVARNLVIKAGTSMAAPIVSGLVALMLQAVPTLTARSAKDRLIAASRFNNNPAGTFDKNWGHGLIDGALL